MTCKPQTPPTPPLPPKKQAPPFQTLVESFFYRDGQHSPERNRLRDLVSEVCGMAVLLLVVRGHAGWRSYWLDFSADGDSSLICYGCSVFRRWGVDACFFRSLIWAIVFIYFFLRGFCAPIKLQWSKGKNSFGGGKGNLSHSLISKVTAVGRRSSLACMLGG